MKALKRLFKWRLGGDVLTGTIVGVVGHFTLRYLEGWQGTPAELNLVLFLTVIFTIVFVAMFERYFPINEGDSQ